MNQLALKSSRLYASYNSDNYIFVFKSFIISLKCDFVTIGYL